MTRFTKVSEESTANALVQVYTLQLAAGHTVTRTDSTSRMGAGRKGRAAEVSVHRTLQCTCGGHLAYGGLTVREDMANLRHFDSDAERAAYEADQADKKARVLRSLGMA